MVDFGNTHLGADDYRPLDWNRKDRTGGSGRGSPPTDWVEWEVASHPQGSYLWNGTEQEVLWDASAFVGPPSANHGSAIAIDSGHAKVTEDGWYTANGYINLQPITATAVYDLARLRFRASCAFTIGTDFIDGTDIVTEIRPSNGQFNSVFYEAKLPFVWVGYMMVDDTVRIYAEMSAAANPGSNWEVQDGFFSMMKLPL